MAAFLVSSLFSSFSFRSAKNGVVFFMVFAVAVHEIDKTFRQPKTGVNSRVFSRPVIVASWIAVLLLAAFSMSKVFAEYHLYRAERSREYNVAMEHFQAAVGVDPEYAGAYLTNASRASAEKDPGTAARLTRKAIDHGLGITAVYSQLAKQQTAAGDTIGVGATFREALSIYPRSVFIRSEFAVFLENQGKPPKQRNKFPLPAR